MDPPSYGRGPKGEIWKIEEKIHPFIQLCTQVLSDEPLFFLINSYTTGLQPAVLSYMIGTEIVSKFGGKVDAQEIGLPVSGNGLVLPCGEWGCWVWLRADWHNMADYGVHFNKELDTWLKLEAQAAFEAKYGHQKFMDVFGKNYLP